MCFLAAGWFWQQGNARQAAAQKKASQSAATNHLSRPTSSNSSLFPLLSRPVAMKMDPARPASADQTRHRFRLTNTTDSLDRLTHSATAILLRNALLDTAAAARPAIPELLRSKGDPGSYIVQSRGAINDVFRDNLANVGATFVSYIPNNACLVRVSAGAAKQLAASPETQAVLPYEPYYKLDDSLLPLAVNQQPLKDGQMLQVTLFPDQGQPGRAALEAAGAAIVAESRSPFGPLLTIRPDKNSLVALAQLPEVQTLELYHPRKLANDLARFRVAVSADTVTNVNYLQLTGSNILVNLNDSGVDASHPDLKGRVVALDPAGLTDLEGHGTHVAGTIAGNGSKSSTVTNAVGSVPGANFRGMAPAARLFMLPVDLLSGPLVSDAYLQESAAQTNAMLSNNSWNYSNATGYDSAAAGYDAAVRDALPGTPGEQSILYVFSAGNSGAGADDGTGGDAGTIASPATAKNVITVGAIEQPRMITNEVVTLDDSGNPVTNQTFFVQTDTDYQVASYSSRGNVGVGTEGPTGRFKPDVVAPGSFVVSCRATGFQVSTNPVKQVPSTVTGEVAPGALNNYVIFVPTNASQLQIKVKPVGNSTNNFPGLLIYVQPGEFPTTTNFAAVGTNELTIPSSNTVASLTPGDWYYSIGNNSAQTLDFSVQTILSLTNANGNYYEVLKSLDDGVGPYYRYDSGTSMATPVVTGLLALMKEFFEQKLPVGLRQTNSPALLKALLINGARSLNPIYDLQVAKSLNIEGWGVVNLTNSLPAWLLNSSSAGGTNGTNLGSDSRPLQYVEQSLTNALATGESKTWQLTFTPDAQTFPARITLVWTDPPGNPAAGIKLVNDLDLVVTNLDTGDVLWGNDIPNGSDYNQASDTNAPPPSDVVNNVENVFIRSPGTNYAVTVRAHRVNVNALPEESPTRVVQDYALVISSGNLETTNAFTFNLSTNTTAAPTNSLVAQGLTVITNGVPLLQERIGANPPISPTTNGIAGQWNFYVFTNLTSPNNFTSMTNGSNVAFITFQPPNLARPRNVDADIDLYVSTNAALTNLDAAVVAAADKSTNRGGSELIFYTNAPLGVIYYVGVKSEDQQGSQYGLIGLSSNQAFDENRNGSRILHGMPTFVNIPDGSPDKPGAALMFAIATSPFPVGRMVITNLIEHQNLGDLVGNLSHSGQFVVLFNHTLNSGQFSGTNVFIFDDSRRGDIPFSRPTDGPSHLDRFIGQQATGAWMLTVVDDALGNTGRVDTLDIRIDPEKSPFGVTSTVPPHAFDYYPIDVPLEATNLIITISDFKPPLPLNLYVRRDQYPTTSTYDKAAFLDPNLIINPAQPSLTLGLLDVPPLVPGRYFIGVYNPNPVPVTYTINTQLQYDLSGKYLKTFVSTNTPLAIPDNALIVSSNNVPVDQSILDVRVGVRIDHPRLSDLVLHLISPQGTRLLLAENRGGNIATNFGSGQSETNGISYTTFTELTNLTTTPIKFAEPPFSLPASHATNAPVVNDGFESGTPGPVTNSGFFSSGWFLKAGEVILLTNGFNGLVSYQGDHCLQLSGGTPGDIRTNFSTVPGKTYLLRFAYTRDPDSISLLQKPQASVSIDGTNILTLAPGFLNSWTNLNWKTTSTVFTATSPTTTLEFKGVQPAPVSVLLDAVNVSLPAESIYYLPEESLDKFQDERGLGDWRLEVWDNRTGPASTNPPPTLISWQLQMVFATPTVNAVTLTNGVPYTGTVFDDQLQYFIVNVPRAARYATNILTGTGDLILVGSRSGLPTGDQAIDDYYVDKGGVNEGEYMLLSTNQPSNAPLQPGQRYYLGVKNKNSGETNSFTIEVDFDQVDFPVDVTVIPLTNGIPYAGILTNQMEQTITAQGTNQTLVQTLDYYQFAVSTNASAVRFDLFPTNGDVNLLVRRYRPGANPLPSLTSFDYQSSNPGTFPEEVLVLTNSLPAPLTPGVWYLAVYGPETFPVAYSIVATEINATNVPYRIIDLTNGVPLNFQVGPGPAVKDYFRLSITDTNTSAKFQLYNLTGSADFVLRLDQFPSAALHDFANFGTSTNAKEIDVQTNAGPSTVPSGPTNLVLFPVPVLSSNSLSFTWNSLVGTNYVVKGKTNLTDNAWTNVSPVITAVSTNTTYAITLPTPYHYFEVTEASPRPSNLNLPDLNGNWYMAVLNNEKVPIDFTIRATAIPVFHPLTNGLVLTNSIGVSPAWRYYSFTVSSNATMAMFQATPSNGTVALYARKATAVPEPWPTLSTYDAFSAEPGFGPQQIILFTNGVPVPLTAGLWYFGVYNPTTQPVSYSVSAVEYFQPVPSIIPLTNAVAYTNTIAVTNTLDYYRFTVSSNANQVVFETLNASGRHELFAQLGLPLPGPANFDYASTNASTNSQRITVLTNSAPLALAPGTWFLSVSNADTRPVTYALRATESLVLPPSTNLVINPQVVITNGAFRLSWASIIGATYRVDGKVNITDPTWNPISSNIVATATVTSYDIPLTNPNRYFRVALISGGIVVPPGSTNLVINPQIILTNKTFTLSWSSVIGATYRVEGKTNITDAAWNPISSNIVATATVTSYSIPLPDPNHYFHVVQLSGAVVVPPANTNLVINPQIVITNKTFNLSWASVVGATYRVEGKTNITDSTWSPVSSNIVATATVTSYSIPLPNPNHYFHVVQLSGGTVVPPANTNLVINPGLVITNKTLVIRWSSVTGTTYRVQGKTNITDSTWSDVSGDITATGAETSYAVPLTNPNHYFRVVQLGATTVTTGPSFIVPNLSWTTNGFQLAWSAPAADRFQVQSSTNLNQWLTLTNIVTSTTGQFNFLDTGSQSGGLGLLRFYRLLLVP